MRIFGATRGRRSLVRIVECVCWLVFGGCSLFLLSTVRAAHEASAQARRVGPGESQSAHPLRDFSDAPKEPGSKTAGGVIGRIEIASLGLSVPILSDIDTASLLRGVGHVPGTATPGGLGTIALAAHRDTFFRPLQHVTTGMTIRVTDATGTYRYMVDSTEVVTPEQVEVLAIRDRPELALVTCYPFHYIGAAPRRFIVHAHLLSITPE